MVLSKGSCPVSQDNLVLQDFTTEFILWNSHYFWLYASEYNYSSFGVWGEGKHRALDFKIEQIWSIAY